MSDVKTFDVKPSENIFSADAVSEIIASENAIDFNFENKDFPVTFKRLDFPANTEFSKTMRITFKCTGSASKNRLVGKEFSIPFYASKYLYEDDSEQNIVDQYLAKKPEQTAMSFADELSFIAQKPATPETGIAPKGGKMYTYSRMKGYAKYLEGKEDKVSFFTLRDAILKSGVVEGQEKNYLRHITTDVPLVRFYQPD